MSNLVMAAGAVCALSACASGVCIAVAYYTPPSLRDAAEDAVDLFQGIWRNDPPPDPPEHH